MSSARSARSVAPSRRRVGTLIGLLALAGSLPTTTRAQFGPWGGFFMPGYQSPAVVDQIHARSQLAGQAAFANRSQSHSPYSGNPNSYINLGRQARLSGNAPLQPHFSTRTRRSVPDQFAGRSRTSTYSLAAATPPAAQPAPAPAGDRSRLSIDGFFDRYERLVWPADAPTEGDLQARRDESDVASLAVFKEFRAQGQAEIGTAAEARARLLEYGRPALEFARSSGSAAVADSFHSFLLSLYDAIGRTTAESKP